MVDSHIKSLEIRDYKSHRYTYVVFDGPLVSFVGDNDAGKSNVFKALDLVLSNKPWPEAHMRLDPVSGVRAKEGHISVEFCDGRRVTRRRKGAKQSLELLHADGTLDTYDTIKDLDWVVAEFTGFRGVTLTSNDQDSLQIVPLENTSPFLLVGKSPETVRKTVEALVSGASIDGAKALALKKSKSLEAELAMAQANVDRLKARRTALSGEDWEKASYEYEEQKEAVQNFKAKGLRLQEAVKAAQVRKDALEAYRALSPVKGIGDALTALRASLEAYNAKEGELQRALKAYEAVKAAPSRKTVEALSSLSERVGEFLYLVKGALEDVLELEKAKSLYRQSLKARKVAEGLRMEVASKVKALKALRKEIAASQSVCPECGREIAR